MNAIVARHTADERRQEILEAAFAEFADTGFEGTSTETIADRAGISQPYLFRLFGTKKHLFLAAIDRCIDQTREAFQAVVTEGDPSEHILERMGHAYLEVVKDRQRLRMQMQAYAACDDPEVRATVQRGFGRLIDEVMAASHASPEVLAGFIAKGMLLNVMASMDVLESTEPWAVALRQGCIGPTTNQ